MTKSRKVERLNAREILESARVPIGADFHTLGQESVDKLLAAANLARYRKPKNANGSRARYFHALLQRRAIKWGKLVKKSKSMFPYSDYDIGS